MPADSPQPPRKAYVPAVTPRLRILLAVVFVLAALLGANSVYLAAVTALEAYSGETYQNYFYQYMFLGHLALGILLILPFLIFGVLHMRNARRRKNRRAVRMGYALFGVSTALLATGLLLTRAGPLEIRSTAVRAVFYWIHVIAPLAAIWLYWLHRLAGPPIKWRVGIGYFVLMGCAVVAAVVFQQADPRNWYQAGSPEGIKYFEPSLARTSNGKFIPAAALDNNAYCQECHADAHRGWAESAHRFSSFNNPAYLASIRETRAFSLEREGNVKRARFCAGCHDPVPFFSGQFDDPHFDDVQNPTAHAGITCTVCHAITNINSPRGNADFTIEEPLHYPFAYSKSGVLKWINRQLVKAKPSYHKKTFLKPFHRTAQFCGTCHKVHLPKELNDYKFLRGQNHYDSFLLSGVSGHGARSFYYPESAHTNCNQCHMPPVQSNDFGARSLAGAPGLSVHSHFFVGANTALPYWRANDEAVRQHELFLKDSARVDLFGVRAEGKIDGQLVAPLGPEVPVLKPGETYLIETVIRTLRLGHLFTQGTADSNEVWLEVVVTSGDRLIGLSGAMDAKGQVDPWSHFVNVFMLDRHGRRIDRRNAQDIFVPLYNHQIPPGAAQTVHYRLRVPDDVTDPVTVEVKLKYRKFDKTYHDFISKTVTQSENGVELRTGDNRHGNLLPVTTMAVDRVTFPVRDGAEAAENNQSQPPAWERWNDFGIGLLLKGTAQLRQAEEAFAMVEQLGRFDGPLNLARVYFREGRLDDAVAAIQRAATHADPPAPRWTLSWLSGVVNRQQGYLDKAVENFRAVLSPPTTAMRTRNLDFRLDYEVINLLGQTLFERARQLRGASRQAERSELMNESARQFEKTLEIDPENVDAHYGLGQIYSALGDAERAQRHQQLHQKYRPDDNARDLAVAAARQNYPAANHAAERVVIYDLHRTPSPRGSDDQGPAKRARATGPVAERD